MERPRDTRYTRYTRQERLAEVGASGQARIAAARVASRAGGLAGEVEALYLAGAGVGTLVVDDAATAAAAKALAPDVCVHVAREPREDGGDAALDRAIAGLAPGAREVGEGAWRALVALRAALEAA